jgi:hypothetical protein
MDPVSQVLAQQNSGSAEGQGFGQFYVQGRQLANQKEQINLSRRHLDLQEKQEGRLQTQQDLLLPLQQKLIEAQATNMGAEAVFNTEKAMLLTQQNAALPELVNLQAEFMNAPDGFANKQLIDRSISLARKYPKIFTPGAPGHELMTQIMAVPMLEQKFNRVLEMAKQMPAGTSMNVPGIGMLNRDPERIGGSEATTDIRNVEYESQLRSQIEATPDGPQKTALQQKLATFQAQTAPSGTTVFDPATGNPIVQIGKQQGGATISTQTKLQQGIANLQKTVSSLEEIENTLRPEDVGLKGVIGEQLLDRIAPQFGLDTSDVQRMDNRTKLKAVVQGALREVSADSRFTENDRIAVEEILPKAGVRETYQNAIQTSKTLRRIFAKRALIDAQTLKIAPPPWALESLDARALSEAQRSGIITKDQAISEFKRRDTKG